MRKPSDKRRRSSTTPASYQVFASPLRRNAPAGTAGFTRKKFAGSPARMALARRVALFSKEPLPTKPIIFGAFCDRSTARFGLPKFVADAYCAGLFIAA